ncbi:helix-turn-helix transcriptional regulator [Vibrio crassostreae]|uniref:helix-turn-helix transcriptional regulator n=1 Tax=Vibrio crassostreae TaxID=246167 RepID=UPI001B300635|nr:helix-turn-helix transcriptional regulator [Vibrio crassostreae]
MSISAKRIKEARMRLGLTQSALGKLLGLNESAASSRINHYEKARHCPPFEFMEKLSRESNTPISCFYESDDTLVEIIQIVHNLPHSKKELILSVLLELNEREKEQKNSNEI